MPSLIPSSPDTGKSLLDRVEDSLLPLINLVFLLLMFFIVAGRLSESPLPRLPAVYDHSQTRQPNADVIVTAAGVWHVHGQQVTKTHLLSALPKPTIGQPLRIAADEAITMADLDGLLRLLASGGHKDVVLLSEPEP